MSLDSRTSAAPVRPADLWDVAESFPHLVWTSSRDGRTEHLNTQAVEYAGRAVDADHPWSWWDLVHPDDAVLARREWARAVAAGTPYQLDCRIRRFDGVYRWHALRSMPRRGRDGSVERWIGTATDIDDSKRFEDGLGRSERAAAEALTLLDTLQSTAPVGFGFVDREFRIVRINEMLATAIGSSAHEPIGCTVAEVVPTIWPQVEPMCRRVLDTGEAVLNVDVSGPMSAEPGRLHHWLGSYYPVRLDDEIIGVGVVVIDVTQQYEAESARRELTHSAIAAIAATIDARDPYTAGHQRRVAAIADAIAAEVGLDEDEREGIRIAATIHDIGKIGIPAEILTRPGELRPEERALLEIHPRTGYEIIAGIDFPWPIAQMVLQHHERLDGTGYPSGLRGDEILFGACIIAVADTVEAMAAHRPYRFARGLEAALDEIRSGRGKRYDPVVVDACIRLSAQGRLPLGQGQGTTWVPAQ